MGTDYAGWFDRINTAGLTWYGMYLTSQQEATNQTATLRQAPTGGVQASVSLPLLIVGAVVIIGAIYLAKKG